MKKIIVSLVVLGVVAAVFGSVAVVSAQGPNNQGITDQETGRGGGRYGYQSNDDLHVENEAVHDLMTEAWSAELGLSVDELNTREDAGERLSQIALSTGMSFEDFWALKIEIQTKAANQALEEGLITQAEADQMLQAAARRAARTSFGSGDGTGLGSGSGFGGRMGGGGGMRGSGTNGANGANCTNLP